MAVILAPTKNVVMNPHENLIKMMSLLRATASPLAH